MTHRPHRRFAMCPNAKAPPHKFVSPCKTTLANSRLLPIAKADGFYGLSDKGDQTQLNVATTAPF